MIKLFIKKIFYYFGILPLYHYYRNKKVISVIALHRVISKSDSRWVQANKEWSISDDFFESLLLFCKRHYNIISSGDLDEYVEGGKKLPSHPLLITFDDGWRDNYDYAYPIAKKLNVPITIFCTTAMINNTYLNWRDVIYALAELDINNLVKVNEILAPYDITILDKEQIGQSIIQINTSVNKTEIINKINQLIPLLGGERQMLSEQEIIEMASDSLVTFGTHGHNHEPMQSVEDPYSELDLSRKCLSELLNKNIITMAYPHSSVNKQIYELASKAGYKYQFGGRDQLNLVDNIKTNSLFFGRIDINELDLVREDGSFSTELTSLQMFRLAHASAEY